MKIIALILLLTSFSVEATPSKPDAQKWLKDFRAAREKTSDALFLNDAIKRAKHTQAIIALRDRSVKLFKQDSECTAAAESLVTIWGNEIELATTSSNPHITASGLSNTAWEGGQNYFVCRDFIDSIK